MKSDVGYKFCSSDDCNYNEYDDGIEEEYEIDVIEEEVSLEGKEKKE
jgi:hypothetical protein